MSRARSAVLPLTVAAALLAGCGSSTVTKRDFIARADAICAGTVRQLRTIAPQTGSSSGTGALAGYLARAVPLVQSEADQLRALKRPSGGTAAERAALARYLGALTRETGSYRDLAAAARRGDTQAVANAEAALRRSPVPGLAAGYGLRACGTPAGTAA
jgi:hypothetical protein